MDCLKGSCSRRIGPPAYGKETNEPRAVGFAETFRRVGSGADAAEYVVQPVRRTTGGQPSRCDSELRLLGHRCAADG